MRSNASMAKQTEGSRLAQASALSSVVWLGLAWPLYVIYELIMFREKAIPLYEVTM